MRGIEHLSPSSLNTWMSSKQLWCAKYLKRVYEPAGIPALVGSAIEDGCGAWLEQRGLESAQDLAAQSMDDRLAERRDLWFSDSAYASQLDDFIADSVHSFTKLIRPPEKGAQQQIKIGLEGYTCVPIVGYIDFRTDDGIIELKTKGCPKPDDKPDKKVYLPKSGPDPEHKRQAAFYSHVTGVPATIVYLSGTRDPRTFTLTQGDVKDAMDELFHAAAEIEAFISRKEPDDELIASLGPLQIDGNNFYRWGEASLWAVLNARRGELEGTA